jgi:hypothetical protein
MLPARRAAIRFIGSAVEGADKQKKRCSFLKKRTKKLFPAVAESMGKSFLLLFFKKEALAFLPAAVS